MKRHDNTPAIPNLPLKVARHDHIPNVTDPPSNDHLVERLEQQEIKSMFNRNTRRGFGVMQTFPRGVTLPNEVLQFSKMSSLGEQI